MSALWRGGALFHELRSDTLSATGWRPIVARVFSWVLADSHRCGGTVDLNYGAKISEVEAKMTAENFRRIALRLEGDEEVSQMGAVDFRVRGRIFPTLAHVEKRYGNLMLTLEQQAEFLAKRPRFFSTRCRRLGARRDAPQAR